MHAPLPKKVASSSEGKDKETLELSDEAIGHVTLLVWDACSCIHEACICYAAVTDQD